jgi:predicted MFS family arabinose efflux permease
MILGMFGLVVSTLCFAVADTYVLLVLARIAQGVSGGASWYLIICFFFFDTKKKKRKSTCF